LLEVFMVTANQGTFPGFQFPTTTPVPDEVFDVLMPQLSGAELKVLLYICRRTFGFKKESDTISLHQIAHGITTRDGRVLDGGTGLCKRHVIRALKVLEKKNIIKVTRKVDETGLNEVNTYSLNMPDPGSEVGTKCPYGSDKTSAGVVTAESPGVVTPVSLTTNREQETVIQETDIVVDVTKGLENFGIAKPAVTKLTQDYPAVYIREKLAIAQGLVAAGSRLVSQNPAGWLRRAIEEDYTLQKHSERHWQRSGREKKYVKLTQAKSRAQHTPEEKSQPAQTVANTPCQCPKNVVAHTREHIPEKRLPEKIDQKENQATWEKTVEQLKQDLPGGEAAARLTGTTLVEVTDTKALIFVPNRFAIPWLERRLYGQITKAIKGVVGKDLDLQFVSCS
jgi:replication protein O/DnaA-like protein